MMVELPSLNCFNNPFSLSIRKPPLVEAQQNLLKFAQYPEKHLPQKDPPNPQGPFCLKNIHLEWSSFHHVYGQFINKSNAYRNILFYLHGTR